MATNFLIRRLLVAVAVLAMVLTAWRVLGVTEDVPDQHLPALQQPTTTPIPVPWHEQITKAGDAVLRSLRRWSILDADDYVVKLLTLGTLNQQFNVDGIRSPDTPVWIVILTKDGGIPLHDGDTGLAMRPINSGLLATPTPNPQVVVAGTYWVWNANTGDLIRTGPAYDDNTDRQPQVAVIDAMQDETPLITTPTAMPTAGTSPNHTPEW